MIGKSLYAIGACMALMLTACDDVSVDDRYIDVPAAKVERTVLLEDFTGQGCVNCPAAHRAIEALEEQYGDHLVAVSIHAGTFGIPADNKRYTGLMQPEGNVFNDRYGIDEYPKGVVDGHMPSLNSDQWADAVYNDISQPTPLTIVPEAEVADGFISVKCTLTSTEALSGNLSVWVVESGIVARQEDVDLGRITDYVHNNVFRACVNGVDGEAVSLTADEPLTVDYTIAVKETDTERWDVSHLTVVAFVKNSGGVVQAARCGVLIKNDNDE